jgi:hypothetical protein
MKKTGLIIAAVFIICIALAGGGIFLMQSSKNAPSSAKPTVTTQKPKTGETTTLKGTILSLLSGGKTVTCQITYPDNKGTGTVYVSDKKFAGDFTMKGADGKETVGHMVSDGTYVYIWSQAMPMGIKMNLAAAKSASQNAQANQSVNINQEVNLNCSPWIPDNSKFIAPSNIKFQDMSQFLQQGTTVTPGTQTGSSPCDQVPAGPARTACLNALNSAH